MGRTGSKNGKDWLKKWEGLAQKMGRSGSKQGRSDSKTGRSDSKKAPCSHHKKNNKSQKPFPFSQVHFYDKNLLLYNRIPPTTLSVSVLLCLFFFDQGFFAWTLTIHRAAGEGRANIPLYHFHSLKNIPTFICNFAWEMTITYF